LWDLVKGLHFLHGRANTLPLFVVFARAGGQKTWTMKAKAGRFDRSGFQPLRYEHIARPTGATLRLPFREEQTRFFVLS
jgi:hypothetical protein